MARREGGADDLEGMSVCSRAHFLSSALSNSHCIFV